MILFSSGGAGRGGAAQQRHSAQPLRERDGGDGGQRLPQTRARVLRYITIHAL